jgi:hypothetical protein
MKSYTVVVIIPLAILLSLLLFSSQQQDYLSLGQSELSKAPNTIGINTNISGITCDETEHLVYHNHTKLAINYENGSLSVPAGIGIIPNECIFWLHTHDDSGIVHVESPYETTFSLGQFLQVWNLFDNSSIADYILQNNLQTKASILLENQSVVLPSTDVIDIPLENNAIITLEIENMTNK